MSRAVTTDWMLRELDVPHEQVIINTSAGDQNTPEYRAINPMAKLPALVDGQTIVTETAAIWITGCFPAGVTIEKALREAVKAIQGHLGILAEDGENISVPGDMSEHQANPDFKDVAWCEC